MERAKKIVVFCDLDGTQNRLAPPPTKTLINLIKGKLKIPESGWPLEPAESSGVVNSFLHKIRPFTRNSEQGLEIIRQVANETGRSIELAILSGRDPGLHAMTRERLDRSGRIKYFDQVYLSNLDSSSGYKEVQSGGEIGKGNSVVLIDDDLTPILRVARLQAMCQDGQTVLGLLIGNISNHPRLLRRAGVILPENVERVPSFLAGAQSLAARIHGGLI